MNDQEFKKHIQWQRKNLQEGRIMKVIKKWLLDNTEVIKLLEEEWYLHNLDDSQMDNDWASDLLEKWIDFKYPPLVVIWKKMKGEE